MKRGLTALLGMGTPLVLGLGAMALSPGLAVGQSLNQNRDGIISIEGDPSRLYAPYFPGEEEVRSTDSLELVTHHLLESFLWENSTGPRASFNSIFIPFPENRLTSPDSTMGWMIVAGFPDYEKQELKVSIAIMGQKGKSTDYARTNLGDVAVHVISPLGLNVYKGLESDLVVRERGHVPIRKNSENQSLLGLSEISEDATDYIKRVARGIISIPATIMSICSDYLGNLLESVQTERMEELYGNRFGDIGIYRDPIMPIFSGQEIYNAIARSFYYRWRVNENAIPRFPYLVRIEITPKRTVSWLPIEDEELGFFTAGEIQIVPPPGE
ncbi:MAG: hypothetical protein NTX24_01075 [Candidatus Pacearchaeota archaeon]|nr:hypothetical protein [Candidatus Pacearchaeota archaeon]